LKFIVKYFTSISLAILGIIDFIIRNHPIKLKFLIFDIWVVFFLVGSALCLSYSESVKRKYIIWGATIAIIMLLEACYWRPILFP